jgi:hypothetical protein
LIRWKKWPALEIPMYWLFTNDPHEKKPNTPISKIERARNGKQDAELRPYAKALSRMNDKDHKLLLHMASKIAKRAKATMNCFRSPISVPSVPQTS